MKQAMRLILLIIAPMLSSRLFGDNRIVIHLRHAPEHIIANAATQAKKESLSKKIITNIDTKTPGQNSLKLVKNGISAKFKPALSGFPATYGGYHDISNPDGLIKFPLRHATPKLYVAITPNVKIATIKGSTISHLEYINDQENPVKIFQFDLKKNEKLHSYWQVTEAPIPPNNNVSPITLIIFTKPDNLYIPIGDFLTADNIQLVLPDIYVLSRSGHEEILLQHLDKQKHFERIEQEKKDISETAYKLMIKNL